MSRQHLFIRVADENNICLKSASTLNQGLLRHWQCMLIARRKVNSRQHLIWYMLQRRRHLISVWGNTLVVCNITWKRIRPRCGSIFGEKRFVVEEQNYLFIFRSWMLALGNGVPACLHESNDLWLPWFGNGGTAPNIICAFKIMGTYVNDGFRRIFLSAVQMTIIF